MLGWLDFLSFWKVSLLSLGAAAWPRSLILISLRSRALSISRARHFAILLSTALACSLGCGASCVFAEGFEACFFFSRKNDEDLFLADFLKNWRRHGMAARLHNNCLVVPTGLCLCSCAASPLPSGKAKGKHGNPCVFVIRCRSRLAAIGDGKRELLGKHDETCSSRSTLLASKLKQRPS